jgi:Tfp pilus assembly protein PilW
MNGKMSAHASRRAGFTVPEMLATLVTSVVLAITMGALLWYTTLAWRRLGSSANLQRDLRVTMDTLSRMTRSATSMTFASSTYTTFYTNRPPASVTASGSNLVYDADTTSGGSTLILAEGTYQLFSVVVGGSNATATVRLGSQGETVSNRVVMYRRN